MKSLPFGSLIGSLIDTQLLRKKDVPASMPVISAVGGGGKTSSLFGLASFMADSGASVAVTTTTHIRDPRFEAEKRRYDRLVIDPDLSLPEAKQDILHHAGITVLVSGEIPEGKRLSGIHPDRAAGLRHHFDMVLVEADGSRGLPVKAPATHEPVIPACTDLVLGLVGLDCLGKPMDENTVHRSGLFAAVTGCRPGEAIRPDHLAALARSGEGLFKGAPPGALRVLVLNKADLLIADSETSRTAETRLRVLFSRPDRGWDAAILCSHAQNTAELLSSFKYKEKI